MLREKAGLVMAGLEMPSLKDRPPTRFTLLIVPRP